MVIQHQQDNSYHKLQYCQHTYCTVWTTGSVHTFSEDTENPSEDEYDEYDGIVADEKDDEDNVAATDFQP